MKVKEAIELIMAEQNMTMMGLSAEMGYKSTSAVRMKLQRNMSIDVLTELCKALGAEVIIRYYDEEYEID